METRIAYCRHCERNTKIVNVIPLKWLQKNIVWFVLLILLGFVLFGFIFLLIEVLVLLMIVFLIPHNHWYCEECGTHIGTKDKVKPRCIYCDAELEPGVSFCPKCGKKFKRDRDSVNCKKCGTENTLEATYCVKCGAKLPASRRKKSQQAQRTEPVDKQEAYGWQYWE